MGSPSNKRLAADSIAKVLTKAGIEPMIDASDLVIRPDTFLSEKIIVGGEVFNI